MSGRYQAFRTYANYLRGWCLTAEFFGAGDPSFGRYSKQQRRLKPRQEEEFIESLRRSWANLRALEILNDGRMAADVLMVQPPIAYYAVYHACRAVLIARGMTPSKNHGGVLGQMSQMCSKGHLSQPWCANAVGSPKDFIVSGLGQVKRPHSNLVRTVVPENARDFAAWSLCTTREDAIEYDLKQLRGKKQRVKSGARQRKEKSKHSTTVFDFMYRLRRESQYEKTDDFLAFDSPEEAIGFGTDLFCLTDLLTLNLEALIKEQVGTGYMLSIYESYAEEHQIDPDEGVIGRRISALGLSPF